MSFRLRLRHLKKNRPIIFFTINRSRKEYLHRFNTIRDPAYFCAAGDSQMVDRVVFETDKLYKIWMEYQKEYKIYLWKNRSK